MRGVTPSLDLRGYFCAGRADDQGEQTRSAAAHLQKKPNDYVAPEPPARIDDWIMWY